MGNNASAKLSLPSDTEILVVRDFKAPKRLVFEAWSRPELVAQWFGCPAMGGATCEMDFREGGSYRWMLRESGQATEHVFSGEYQEIAPPDRLVFVERYEPIPDSDHVVTIELVEHDGVTTMTMTMRYPSVQHRDGHLKSGMETGMWEAFDRLEQAALSLERSAA